jgi:undecaprenyl diphosphate synthase
MDGNRRWAKAKGKSTAEGHKEGYKALKDLLKTVRGSGVEYVTVYAFSTENWQRSQSEVEGLLSLFRWVLSSEAKKLADEKLAIRFLGETENLPEDIRALMQKMETDTARHANAGTLAICFNYGGQHEIVSAANLALAAGRGKLDEASITQNLYAPDIPPIDLIIRTSGEQRLSNFMLWRAAYAELYFTDTLWPDFTGREFTQILEQYAARARRFGA